MSVDLVNTEVARGVRCLQTDDTSILGNPPFVSNEQNLSVWFDVKPPTFLKDNQLVTFDGVTVNQPKTSYKLSQSTHIDKLSKVSIGVIDRASFVSERARCSYISAVSRRDLSFGFASCSQCTDADATAAKRHNKAIPNAKKYRGGTLVHSAKATIWLPVFSDESLHSNPYLSSHIWYVTVLPERNDSASIFHYSSVKYKRVTWSVFATELIASLHAFDVANIVRVTLNHICSAKWYQSHFIQTWKVYMTG